MIDRSALLKCGVLLNTDLTGKGVKVAVFEYSSSDILDHWNVDNPLDITSRSMNPNESTTVNHIFNVCGVVRKIAPNAKISFLPANEAGLNYAIENGYQIATFSGGKFNGPDELKAKLASKCYMIVDANNKGNWIDHYESFSALDDYWHTVGAACLNSNGELKYETFTCWGMGKIKNLSLQRYALDDEYPNILIGTSFSAPTDAGMLALIMEDYHNKYGVYPTVEMLEIIKSRMCQKILNDPIREGAGVFILPDLSKFDYGMTVKMNSNIANVDGREVKLESPSFIADTSKGIPVGANGYSYIKPTTLREMGF